MGAGPRGLQTRSCHKSGLLELFGGRTMKPRRGVTLNSAWPLNRAASSQSGLCLRGPTLCLSWPASRPWPDSPCKFFELSGGAAERLGSPTSAFAAAGRGRLGDSGQDHLSRCVRGPLWFHPNHGRPPIGSGDQGVGALAPSAGIADTGKPGPHAQHPRDSGRQCLMGANPLGGIVVASKRAQPPHKRWTRWVVGCRTKTGE